MGSERGLPWPGQQTARLHPPHRGLAPTRWGPQGWRGPAQSPSSTGRQAQAEVSTTCPLLGSRGSHPILGSQRLAGHRLHSPQEHAQGAGHLSAERWAEPLGSGACWAGRAGLWEFPGSGRRRRGRGAGCWWGAEPHPGPLRSGPSTRLPAWTGYFLLPCSLKSRGSLSRPIPGGPRLIPPSPLPQPPLSEAPGVYGWPTGLVHLDSLALSPGRDRWAPGSSTCRTPLQPPPGLPTTFRGPGWAYPSLLHPHTCAPAVHVLCVYSRHLQAHVRGQGRWGHTVQYRHCDCPALLWLCWPRSLPGRTWLGFLGPARRAGWLQLPPAESQPRLLGGTGRCPSACCWPSLRRQSRAQGLVLQGQGAPQQPFPTLLRCRGSRGCREWTARSDLPGCGSRGPASLQDRPAPGRQPHAPASGGPQPCLESAGGRQGRRWLQAGQALAPSSEQREPAVGTRSAGGPLGPQSQEPSQLLLPPLTWPLPPSRLWGRRPALPSGFLSWQPQIGCAWWPDPQDHTTHPLSRLPHHLPLVSAQTHWHPKAGAARAPRGRGHGSEATCAHTPWGAV